MICYFTFVFVLLAMLLASTITHAQQGNLPVPVQKLPPYPPVVCVAPNWTTEPCENRTPTPYGPQNEPSGWQCDSVRVTEIFDSTALSMEFLVTGTERRDNRFKLEGLDRQLYLNGKLCTRFKPEDIRFEIPLMPAPVKCLKPDGTEELCESRHPEPRRTTTVLYDEPGGDFWSHWNRFKAFADGGDDVEIRGTCASACTLIIVHVPNDKICFGDRASLQFHVSRNVNGEPDIAFTTRMMVNQYPQDIREWIMAKGGVEKMNIQQMWTLDAAELWKMGYRKCGPEAPPVPWSPVIDTRSGIPEIACPSGQVAEPCR